MPQPTSPKETSGGAGADAGDVTSAIAVERLTSAVGGRVEIERDRMRDDPELPQLILDALEEVGVLVFSDMHLDPETQVAFCRRLGTVELGLTRNHEVDGIFRITPDRSKSASAAYFAGNFGWHIDGLTPTVDTFPPKVTMLTASIIAEGGDTMFASTYTPFEELSADEQERYAELRVVHCFRTAVMPYLEDPSPAILDRVNNTPSRTHPLVWTHDSGRRSLVIGTHADHVDGWPKDESDALLQGLLEHATAPERVYRHTWRPGDTVLWDNRGLVHRVQRYDTSLPREMLRTTVLGEEPIK
jgi:alpha-ketoglutarate-dependent taurine dioxygenase